MNGKAAKASPNAAGLAPSQAQPPVWRLRAPPTREVSPLGLFIGPLGSLGSLGAAGSGAWTRTTIQGFKVPCPAIRRHRNGAGTLADRGGESSSSATNRQKAPGRSSAAGRPSGRGVLRARDSLRAESFGPALRRTGWCHVPSAPSCAASRSKACLRGPCVYTPRPRTPSD